jgi:hypothetical protein
MEKRWLAEGGDVMEGDKKKDCQAAGFTPRYVRTLTGQWQGSGQIATP